ncbi:MAG: ABC transporter permease [Deltaproteobacteria bacterium]|nr:ABC transporter permease [Deltaproteobacteria bacterium]
MNLQKAHNPILSILKYTLADEIQHKSFIVLFLICAAFVFLTRGCYNDNFVMNGQVLNAQAIGWFVSKASFHVIAAAVTLIAALLSMRIFRRDRDEGIQSCILAKPIARWQYVAAKTLGLWMLSLLFMLVLHSIILFITLLNTKTAIFSFLFASLLCSSNLLFVILAVLFLSLLLPEVIAFLCILGVSIVSYIGDGIYAASHSQMAQAMVHQPQGYEQSLTWWQVVYYLWPKLSAVQQWATALISGETFRWTGLVHPLVNVLLYCLLMAFLLFMRFEREDIV